jgi:hypothetical protein
LNNAAVCAPFVNVCKAMQINSENSFIIIIFFLMRSLLLIKYGG